MGRSAEMTENSESSGVKEIERKRKRERARARGFGKHASAAARASDQHKGQGAICYSWTRSGPGLERRPCGGVLRNLVCASIKLLDVAVFELTLGYDRQRSNR